MTTAIVENAGITSMDPQEVESEKNEVLDEQIAQAQDIHQLTDQRERYKAIAINERKRAQKVAEFMHQHIKAGAKERTALELRVAAHQQEIAKNLAELGILKEQFTTLTAELKQARLTITRFQAGQDAVLEASEEEVEGKEAA
tara:strand:+ start:214 stop:642 length:429 start_codon:yes stop_codon:yes gene_type:complete